MRKLLFALICILSWAGLKAQTYVSGHVSVTVTDSMSHDSTKCGTYEYVYYHVTVDTSYIGDSVRIVDSLSGMLAGVFVNTTGASPWTFTSYAGGSSSSSAGAPSFWDNEYWPSTGAFAYLHNTPRKVLRAADTVFTHCGPDSIWVSDPCEHSTVSGKIYADNNGNCIFDAGDVAMNIPMFSGLKAVETYTPPGAGRPAAVTGTFSGTTATYSMIVQKSWMATCTVSIPSYYYFVYSTPCAAGPYVFTSLPGVGADFPFQCTSNVDVQCNILSAGAIRLHTPFLLHPYVNNTGCDSASGKMTLVKDPRAIYNAALSSHPADTVHGDTLIWNYANLTNLTGSGYWHSFLAGIHLTPDTGVVVGDTMCFRVFTNIPATDINAANNDQYICLPVVYSYDPNLKEVSPKGTGAEGLIPASTNTLTYTLHFQNTGSAAAYNIKITDTLDSHVNPESLQILGSTHNMSPTWLAPNVVQFVFNSINLPDSLHNEPASHGAVQFKVGLNPGLAPGTQIKNKGYIYFDLNPAVITNTARNTIAMPSKVELMDGINDVRVYPNPTTDRITVENLSQGAIEILNLNGQVIFAEHIASNKASIDVSQIPAGVYILRASTESGISTRKFIKY